MKVTTERLEGSRVSLEVEAPKEVVDQALQKAYRKVVREVNVPGFRRGKAPRSILERYYGKEILYDEAIRQVLPEQYVEAVKQANIEPVDDPEFTDVYFREGEPFRFKAVVYVRPEVQLQDYNDIAVPFETPTVSEEDIDKQLEILKERMAELRPLEEGTALKEGHYATCRVKGIEGGDVKVEFDDDLSYVEVGRDYSFIPGLGQALIDMKKGDVKEFSGKYPGKEGEEPKEARFQVEVKEVYEKLVPKDAEEVAKNLGKGSSQEVRDEIRKNLLEVRMRMAIEQHLDKVEDALLEKAQVEIPKVMIDRRVGELLERLERRLRESDATLEQYLESSGQSMEDLMAELKKEAEKDVKRKLVLEAVAQKENVEVAEETVDKMVEAIAKDTGRDSKAVKTTLELRGTLEDMKRQLGRLEALKLIARRAAEKAGTPLPADEEKKTSTEDTPATGAEGTEPKDEGPRSPEPSDEPAR